MQPAAEILKPPEIGSGDASGAMQCIVLYIVCIPWCTLYEHCD